MALRFVLKKFFEGGISSSWIGVRLLAYINSILGVPTLHCKGVNAVIGLPTSVNCIPSIALEVSIGIVGDNGGIT
jgi:hypothetical protein